MRSFGAPAIGALAIGLALAACAPAVEDTPAYKAACEGPPLRGDTARRNQAFEEGYEINRTFDCIDKASYAQVNEQKARSAAEGTPEALARREAERLRRLAEEQAAAAAAAPAPGTGGEPAAAGRPAPAVVRVDVNTASEAELAAIPPLDRGTAARIVEQRSIRPFTGWEDLVSRVVGLSAAQSAMMASVSGLTVNGASLPGAPPDAEVAARLRAR